MAEQARRSGFTLIELLTAVTIIALITVGLGQLVIFNDRAYQNVDQTTDAQQSLRAVVDLMERDLRHTGMLVPEVTSACGVDSTSGPDRLYTTDWQAVEPGSDLIAYGGAQILAPSSFSGTVLLNLNSLILEPAPPLRAAYDVNNDGTNDSDFRVGAGAIIASTTSPGRGTACGTVTAVDVGGSRITVELAATFASTAPGGDSFVAVPANEYRVVGDRIFWSGMLLSHGVEDFQVAYIFDEDGDNVIDAGETRGDGQNPNPNYVSSARPASELREVRASFVTRTRLEDQEWTQGQPLATENRVLGGPPNDGFRRRLITTRVRLRNVGRRIGVI